MKNIEAWPGMAIPKRPRCTMTCKFLIEDSIEPIDVLKIMERIKLNEVEVATLEDATVPAVSTVQTSSSLT